MLYLFMLLKLPTNRVNKNNPGETFNQKQNDGKEFSPFSGTKPNLI